MQYLETWSQQLEKYRSDFIVKSAKIREQVQRHVEQNKALAVKLSKKEIDPDAAWKLYFPRIFESAVLVRDAYNIAGRGELIKAYMIHMQMNPSAGLSDIWFMKQAEVVQAEANKIDFQTKAFYNNLGEKMQKGDSWISELEQIARDQGKIQGKILELQSLYKQAMVYYRDIGYAMVEDQRREQERLKRAQQASQALLGLGIYMNQLNYQQQLINSLNRPRTCTAFGNSITCY